MPHSEYERELILLSKLSKIEKIALCWYVISDDKPSEKAIDCYRITKEKSTSNDSSAYVLARKWLNKPQCVLFMEKIKEKVFSKDFVVPGTETIKAKSGKNSDDDTQVADVEDDTNISMPQLVKILSKNLITADRARDSKTVSDIANRLSQIFFKRNESETKEEQVRRYMPLQCASCALFINEQTKTK